MYMAYVLHDLKKKDDKNYGEFASVHFEFFK